MHSTKFCLFDVEFECCYELRQGAFDIRTLGRILHIFQLIKQPKDVFGIGEVNHQLVRTGFLLLLGPIVVRNELEFFV